MKKNHEVVGLVIDAIQQNDTLRFLSAITGLSANFLRFFLQTLILRGLQHFFSL